MLAAAWLAAPSGSLVLTKHCRRNIDFSGETALFSIFIFFFLCMFVFREEETSVNNLASGRNLLNIWILSYQRNKLRNR